jgi:hypothetical protein
MGYGIQLRISRNGQALATLGNLRTAASQPLRTSQ